MPGRKPKKTELAKFKILHDSGMTANAIGNTTGRDPKTVRKWLSSEVYNEPDVQELIETIKANEVNDLYLLGAKARKRLHELVDKGDSRMIETIALQDRAFQQRRLLEGQSTENIGISSVIRELDGKRNDIQSKLAALRGELPEDEEGKA